MILHMIILELRGFFDYCVSIKTDHRKLQQRLMFVNCSWLDIDFFWKIINSFLLLICLLTGCAVVIKPLKLLKFKCRSESPVTSVTASRTLKVRFFTNKYY